MDNALDLVTLLLSKDPTKQYVESSFSHQFRSLNIPRGSFGLDKNPAPSRDEDNIEDEDLTPEEAERREKQRLVATGGTIKALESATDVILKAATQLETEVRKETKYWEEILSISEKGWLLQRYQPKARVSPFAVRYGFSEARDQFKARGLAPLRIAKDGKIILDPSLASQPKTLRVRISDNGKIVGTSRLPRTEDSSDLEIEHSIQRARESIFEEELFHELSLESRNLRAFNVESRNSVIELPAQAFFPSNIERKLLIDCVSRESSDGKDNDSTQDQLAHAIAGSLRVLLAHEHRLRLQRRSSLPTPLTQNKTPVETVPMLRTILGFFDHVKAVDRLADYVCSAVATLRSAGLEASAEVDRERSWSAIRSKVGDLQKNSASGLDRLFQVFLKPLEGVTTLTLPTSTPITPEQITITARTSVGPPSFGTEYRIILPQSLRALLSMPQDDKYEVTCASTEDLEDYINWILSIDVARALTTSDMKPATLIIDEDIPWISLGRESKLAANQKRQQRTDIHVDFQRKELRIVTQGEKDDLVFDGTTEQKPVKEQVKSLRSA